MWENDMYINNFESKYDQNKELDCEYKVLGIPQLCVFVIFFLLCMHE